MKHVEGILTGETEGAPTPEAASAARRRLDAWGEYFNPRLWWQTFAECGIDVPFYSHRERPIDEVLPWDHIQIRFGREFRVREQSRRLRSSRKGRGGVVFRENTLPLPN